MSSVAFKPRLVKTATAVSRLTLEIEGTVYAVQRLDPDPDVAAVAFRLTKADGTVYDVALGLHGHECSCPDFIFHRDGKDPRGCKHIRCLHAWGLLPGKGA